MTSRQGGDHASSHKHGYGDKPGREAQPAFPAAVAATRSTSRHCNYIWPGSRGPRGQPQDDSIQVRCRPRYALAPNR
jgi:hypothetical protein